nr:hypothetical protein [Angustibacter aerolatus]
MQHPRAERRLERAGTHTDSRRSRDERAAGTSRTTTQPGDHRRGAGGWHHAGGRRGRLRRRWPRRLGRRRPHPRTTHSAAQPAAQPAESTRRTREAGQTRRTEAKKAATSATSTSGRRGTTPSKTPLPADDVDQAAYDAYWGAGYDENDASLLAEPVAPGLLPGQADRRRQGGGGQEAPIEPGEGAKPAPEDRPSDRRLLPGRVRLRRRGEAAEGVAHRGRLRCEGSRRARSLLAHQTLPVKP